MARTATPVPESREVPVNEALIAQDFQAANQLAELTIHATTQASALAKELGYQGALTVGALEDEIRFYQLQSAWARNYAMALSTTGTARAGYVDKLSTSLPALSDALKAQSSSSEEWRIKLGEYIAQADKSAGLLEQDAADDGFKDTALELLDSIDSALETLGEQTKGAEQLLADAINAGSESNLAGLRAVVAALQGKPIPAFAGGGQHSGGLRLVGELGPELEVTGAARYWSASQTRSLLGSSQTGSNSELIALLEQLVSIGTAQCQLLLRLVRPTERWELYGTPPVRIEKKKVTTA